MGVYKIKNPDNGTKGTIDYSEWFTNIFVRDYINNLKTKQEAIKKMVKYFKAEIKPKNMNKEEEYYKKALKFSEDKK